MELISRLIALILFLLLSPLLFFISIISIMSHGRPIIFQQNRVGYKNVNFKIYKFRTMVENSGSLLTAKNDIRVTTFGKFLRKTKLDEIPQLLNILKGEMRFIGPRPEVSKFTEKADFSFLSKIKPGISDYSSIILRDESKILNSKNNDYDSLLQIKVQLAHFYSDNKNFFLDLRLVFITIISVFFNNNNLIKNIILSDLKTIDKKIIREIEAIMSLS